MTDAAVEARMAFDDVLVAPGDVALFDSYLPHRSDSNRTARPRRAAYLTYNKASEGDLHAAYYAKKSAVWATGGGGAISVNDDFAGDVVR